jgi:hypothetical protein
MVSHTLHFKTLFERTQDNCWEQAITLIEPETTTLEALHSQRAHRRTTGATQASISIRRFEVLHVRSSNSLLRCARFRVYSLCWPNGRNL